MSKLGLNNGLSLYMSPIPPLLFFTPKIFLFYFILFLHFYESLLFHKPSIFYKTSFRFFLSFGEHVKTWVRQWVIWLSKWTSYGKNYHPDVRPRLRLPRIHVYPADAVLSADQFLSSADAAVRPRGRGPEWPRARTDALTRLLGPVTTRGHASRGHGPMGTQF
jgi:hypothetical protein